MSSMTAAPMPMDTTHLPILFSRQYISDMKQPMAAKAMLKTKVITALMSMVSTVEGEKLPRYIIE